MAYTRIMTYSENIPSDVDAPTLFIYRETRSLFSKAWVYYRVLRNEHASAR